MKKRLRAAAAVAYDEENFTMNENDKNTHQCNRGLKSFLFSKNGLVLAGSLGLIGYVAWTSFDVKVGMLLPYLPYLFLLACPLMHIFMHKNHGANGNKANGNMADNEASVQKEPQIFAGKRIEQMPVDNAAMPAISVPKIKVKSKAG